MNPSVSPAAFKLDPGALEVLARARQLAVSSVFGGLLVYLLQALWQFADYPTGRSGYLHLLSYGLFVWYLLYLLIAHLGEEFGVFGSRRGLRYAAFDAAQIAAAFGALYLLGFIDTSVRISVADQPWRYAVACLGIASIAVGGMLLAEKRELRDSIQQLRVISLLAAVSGAVLAFVSRQEQRAFVLLVIVGILLLLLLGYAWMRLKSAAAKASEKLAADARDAIAKTDATTLDATVKALASIQKLDRDIGALRQEKLDKDIASLSKALSESKEFIEALRRQLGEQKT
jgi:hypothetical protein